jgi:hypothetical protein
MIDNGNLEGKYIIQTDLSYDVNTNEYILEVTSEKQHMKFGIPRHRIHDMLKNFYTLIDQIDAQYPENIQK